MPEPPLAGFTVVDLSTGIAGAYCTKLLADGGADVVKVEPPEGDPLRGWSSSGTEIPPGEDGALFSFLAGSKRSVVTEAVGESRRSRRRGMVARLDADTCRDPLRASAPDRDRDHAVRARGPVGGPSCDGVHPAGLGGRDRRLRPRRAGPSAGPRRRATRRVAGRCLRGGRDDGVGRTRDRRRLDPRGARPLPHLLSRHLPRPDGPADVPDAVRPDPRRVRGEGRSRRPRLRHRAALARLLRDERTSRVGRRRVAVPAARSPRTRDRCVGRRAHGRRGSRAGHGLPDPNAPIGNGANLPGFDHFRARGTFVPNPRGAFLQPDLPYRLDSAELRRPEPAPRVGEHTGTVSVVPGAREPLPLEGLRVLDLTAFWAGPSCTHLLALLGAEVIHLESPSRLDGVRMVGAARAEEQWWERSPIFSALNTSKKSLTLDLGTDRGRELLHRLIPTCDVLIEAYTPRVLDQLGLSFELAKELRRDIVMVRMPGFGLDGPWRDVSAMAFIIEDAAGLTWMTGYPDANPYEPWTIADPNAGIHALNGLLLALEHRRRSGEAVLVEAAMIDAALNVAAEQTIEHSAYGALLERAGNRGPAAAPQNAYLTADLDELGNADCWVAIAVVTDEQWEALREALGDPQWAAVPGLATAAGRREQHDVIDEQLAAWCRERSGEDVVDLLWGAGVPVGRVIQPNEQANLPQLAAREFFEEVEHPVAGRARHSTMPMRFSSRSGRVHTRHAPLLGEHNRELLDAIGLTDDEIDALEAEGVIGTKPHG